MAVTGGDGGEESSMEDMRKCDPGSRHREHNGSRAETGLCTSWRTEASRCGWSPAGIGEAGSEVREMGGKFEWDHKQGSTRVRGC